MKCYEWRTLERLENMINAIGKYTVNIREFCEKQGIFHLVNGSKVITSDDLQEVAYLFDIPKVFAM